MNNMFFEKKNKYIKENKHDQPKFYCYLWDKSIKRSALNRMVRWYRNSDMDYNSLLSMIVEYQIDTIDDLEKRLLDAMMKAPPADVTYVSEETFQSITLRYTGP